jgi:hypothetical protein
MFLVVVVLVVVVKVMAKNHVLGHGHGCSQGYMVKNHVLGHLPWSCYLKSSSMSFLGQMVW